MAASSRGPMYKIVLLGELGVGKTSIFKRLRDGEFEENVTTTTGIDSCTKTFTINGQAGAVTVSLSIWDTAGVERFRTLTRNYYRGAHATVFVYSVDEPSSLHYLTSWVRDAESFASNATKFLVGNKIDIDRHDIDANTAEAFARSHDFANTFQISAKDDRNVTGAFSEIAAHLYQTLGGGGSNASHAPSDSPVSGNVDLNTSPPQESKSGCC